MYNYRPHPMTVRDKDAVIISLFVRALIKFNKIHQQRLGECDSPKWQQIFKDVRAEVTEALQLRSDLKLLQLIRQYTAEMEAMDVSEFFPKPKLQPMKAVTSRDQQKKMEQNHMLEHPTGERIYSLRRRVRQNSVKPPAVEGKNFYRQAAA